VRTEKTSALQNQEGAEQVSYSDDGNATEEIRFNKDGSVLSRTVFDYDNRRQLSTITVNKADGSISLRRTYSHKGTPGLRQTEEFILDGGMRVISKVNHVYDSSGRPVELVSFDSNGKQQDRIVTNYDGSGKTSDVTYFFEDNRKWIQVRFVHNSKGSVTEMDEYGPDGSLASKHVFDGDIDRGSDFTMTQYDSKGSLIVRERYIHEFDSQGNWIKETKSKFNPQSGSWQTVEITERKITYY
jgi:hypothetical protein